MLIGEAELCDYVRDVVPELRTTRFFYLALSLGKLLDMPAGAVTVEALWQLIQEYEYHFANSAMQMVRYTTARNSECVYPQLNPREEGEDEAAKANLYRFGNEVVYLHLQTPHVAFELDYREVLFSLCDVLSLLYNKVGRSLLYSSPHRPRQHRSQQPARLQQCSFPTPWPAPPHPIHSNPTPPISSSTRRSGRTRPYLTCWSR